MLAHFCCMLGVSPLSCVAMCADFHDTWLSLPAPSLLNHVLLPSFFLRDYMCCNVCIYMHVPRRSRALVFVPVYVYAQTITCTPVQEREMTRPELCTDIVRRRAVGTGKGQGRAEVADQIMP